MIRRTVKIQLIAFVVISIVGIAYVGSNYVGFRFPWQSSPYTVHMMLSSSGGIFSNAEVTERGVTVGRVGTMSLRRGGVDVALKINPGTKIPADVRATVANLSAVGEQYVDLEPQTDAGPYLKDGSRIAADHTTVPLDDATMLVDLDKLVTSVDRKHLATVINELGKGFDNLGPSLQRLIDNGNQLTQAAINSLPEQLRLINDSVTVLNTQRDVSAEIKSWAASMASFSDQLRVSDPDIRSLLDNGVGASKELAGLLRDNESVLPTLLGNLITVNQIQAVRLPYVRATLELFPSLTAGGFYVTPGDGTAHFGMVQDNNSPPCTQGYESTKLRGNNHNGNHPSDWGGPANLNAYCQAPGAADVDNRGSRFVPRPDNAQVTNADSYPGPQYGRTTHPTVQQQEQGGYPFQKSGSGSAAPASASQAATNRVYRLPYDPVTGLLTGVDGKTYQLGYHGPLDKIFGSSSWEWLLLAPTMR